MNTVITALILGSAAGPVLATPLVARDIVGSIPAKASDIENKYQPFVDFDTDGCYYTSAINKDGKTNPGISNVIAKKPQDGCRTKDRLENNNVYSRKRCNNGVCAIMYEYYFEKDQAAWGSFAGGHKHDWENVVVFTKGNDIIRVAPSCHGKYDHAISKDIPIGDNHAKVVYHKDGGGTHCFRIANKDDEKIENYTGKWFLGNLVGWGDWPNGDLRKKMLDAWSGGVGPKLPDNKFTDTLKAAAGNAVPGFDPAKDA